MSGWWKLFPFLLCLSAHAAQDGKVLFQQHCSSCHENSVGRAPSREDLGSLTQREIGDALTRGPMRVQASELRPADILAISSYLSSASKPVKSDWSGWGRDLENSRYQPDPDLKAEDVPRLKLKWVFGYPGSVARGQPTVLNGRVYVASQQSQVFALDAGTGKTLWSYGSSGNVRGAVVIGGTAKPAAFFGDDTATVYAVDAESGAPLWKVKVEDFPGAVVTGAPAFYQGRLYVPVSSNEEAVARYKPGYECCKFRGSVVALDASTGKELWKTYTVAEQPKAFKKNASGKDMYGPAGASVWSSPTIDAKRELLYVGTGNSYTDAELKTSDAILAMSLVDGHIAWAAQETANDNFITNCMAPGTGNCPQTAGDDFDFGSSPILHPFSNGRQVILAGQKSSTVYALDPDHGGALLWKVKLSPGGFLGGIEWGPAADEHTIYAPVSDAATREGAKPGLYAIDVLTGKTLWSSPAPTPECSWGTAGCNHAESQAVTVIPGIVFSGAMDGHLRAYSTSDGAIRWDFDTARSFDAVAGGIAKGGGLDAGGPAIVGGMVFVNSGYAMFAGHPGNALLAFSVDGN